ncbi:hypothetical protein [Bacteroides congonensis]|uniref:hypothetical protein n=1 Tax=Bacteroides congonensis TaxID=1871006 RepID=UPI00321B40AB
MKLKWDQTGERIYETGVSNGVLYVQKANGSYDNGVAWNGLSTVTESPSGAESNAIYADNIKYLALTSAEEFGATVEAYTYPDKFAECDGSAEVADGVMIGQQDRKAFGMAYKTIVGNDTEKNAHGYKLHMIYGATAAPSEKGYSTVNDSSEPITLSWELSTTPVEVTGYKPTATLVIDSTKANSEKLKALEDILFGSDETEARLPMPNEVISLMKEDVQVAG